MIQTVPFIKYSSCGNSFIIVDELTCQRVSESEKALFAAQAANIFFGIGSDGVIFLQPNHQDTLNRINSVFHYWHEKPDTAGAGFILRMFEPDGSESFSCGNGLLSIANYLFCQYGLYTAEILTEVPTGFPRKVSIGTDIKGRTNWTNMGKPGRIPEGMVFPEIISRVDDSMDYVKPITIRLDPDNSLQDPVEDLMTTISGYLIYTGEPHFIIFTENDTRPTGMVPSLYIPETPGRAFNYDLRFHASSRYIRHIGRYLNMNGSNLFPKGINIDFARITGPDSIEYRCFERGVNRETLSCGTGAVACYAAARNLNLIQSDRVGILPHLCRLFNPESGFTIQKTGNSTCLFGEPQVVCNGDFNYNSPDSPHRNCNDQSA